MAEVLVATAIAGVILSLAVLMFSQSLDISTVAAGRGEMQQNARVAINLLDRDISIAGTGIISGGIQLPFGAGINKPRLGCDMTLTCYIMSGGSALNYYRSLDGGTTYNSYMYAITPAAGQGPTINGVPTDVITVIFKDINYPLSWPAVAGTPAGPLDQAYVSSIPVTGSAPIIPTGTIVFPATVNPGIGDAAYGLNLGDILCVQNLHGAALVTVTAVTPASSTVTFAAAADPLFFNQMSSPVGALTSIQNYNAATPSVPTGFPAQTTAFRVIVVSYFVSAATDPYVPTQTKGVLMRQVNGLKPIPVAENIENLQLSYDVFNPTTQVVYANVKDPVTLGYSPNQIGKVNIFVAARSSTARLVNRGYSRFTMATSATPRNLDFVNRYK